jgi:hypothetical protein
VSLVQGMRSLAVAVLKGLPHLEHVNGLQGCTALRALSISGCGKLQLLDLKGVAELRLLTVTGCGNLREVAGLEGLWQLERLLFHLCGWLPELNAQSRDQVRQHATRKGVMQWTSAQCCGLTMSIQLCAVLPFHVTVLTLSRHTGRCFVAPLEFGNHFYSIRPWNMLCIDYCVCKHHP